MAPLRTPHLLPESDYCNGSISRDMESFQGTFAKTYFTVVFADCTIDKIQPIYNTNQDWRRSLLIQLFKCFFWNLEFETDATKNEVKFSFKI